MGLYFASGHTLAVTYAAMTRVKDFESTQVLLHQSTGPFSSLWANEQQRYKNNQQGLHLLLKQKNQKKISSLPLAIMSNNSGPASAASVASQRRSRLCLVLRTRRKVREHLVPSLAVELPGLTLARSVLTMLASMLSTAVCSKMQNLTLALFIKECERPSHRCYTVQVAVVGLSCEHQQTAGLKVHTLPGLERNAALFRLAVEPHQRGHAERQNADGWFVQTAWI